MSLPSKSMSESSFPKTLDPNTFQPQLASIDDSFTGNRDWLYEVKLDGYRIIAWVSHGDVRLMSRNGLDWTDRFPHIAQTLKESFAPGTVLDGEIVVLDSNHISRFSLLQNWLKLGKGQKPKYFLFDLIASKGIDLTSLPLLKRQAELEELCRTLPPQLHLCQSFRGNGLPIFEQACRSGLEGLVVKNPDAPYSQFRTDNWIKWKCVLEDDFVVVGFVKSGNTRTGFKSLVLASVDESGQLTYVGRVGSGFDERQLVSIAQQLSHQTVTTSPLKFVPDELQDGCVWVSPELVLQVKYAEKTPTGVLRHPVFVGLRDDKTPPIKFGIQMKRIVKLTHPERIIFPGAGITKQDLFDYYQRVSQNILPFISGRPVAVVRCPEGVTEECFFQKHISQGMPDSLMAETGKKDENVIVVDSEEELLTLIQYGVIEIHPWQAPLATIEEPDMLVFDLDPSPEVEWKTVVESALVMGELLRSIGLKPYIKTSGGKGFHIVCMVKPSGLSWGEFKDFAHLAVRALEVSVPGRFVTVMTKSKRKGKIFLDYLRNGRGSTSVAPYSVRSRENAPVSVPIEWSQVQDLKSGDQFSLKNVDSWLKSPDKGPWSDLFKSGKKITPEMISTLQSLADQ